jgi:hypothetical protein
MTLPLRPKRGGFLRPFGCGEFIHQFLLGMGPYDSTRIDPYIGAPQAVIFQEYKMALIRATALDRATRIEEKQARKQKRTIDPARIEELTERLISRMPYKAQNCRFHSFVVYFSTIQRLGWVEATGREEPSEFQEHYPPGPPRRYYRLTEAGKGASEADWANPHRALYGSKPIRQH